MNSTAECPQCGRLLPVDAPSGVCPQCLLGVGMRTDSQPETLDRPGGFTPPKPHELAQHFPQLEILDLIGHGGMGAVYKARQRGLDRFVALKILPPEVGEDPSFEERFAREARALASLSHPNIVGVHDSGNAGGLYYLLMEFVDGIDLREAIQTGELTPNEAMAIVPQICEALQYAHDEGVVRRDIKPENILLDKKGRVKIADFGLARMLKQTPDNFTLTGTNQVMGTPKYMAPEQIEGSHDVDHRADIYSLGVVFYEMLTGELPLGRFDAPSRKIRLDVRVDDVVLRTLEKEPGRRYQHASELKTDVESISGVANVPPHLRRGPGVDYRTEMELFGWPLVHVATGIDPKTGRQRVAKGIIAMGDIAVGGVALGGMACGIIAFGGLAGGLITFAGASFGLLLAVGGAAIGLGFSCGGLAIGSVAMGGMAIGYYGFGGSALAVHGMSGMGKDPEAVRFFEPWAFSFMKVQPFVITILAMIVGICMTAVAAVTKRRSTERKSDQDSQFNGSRANGGCALGIMTLIVVAGVCVVAIAVLVAAIFSYGRVSRERNLARQAQLIEATTAREETVEPGFLRLIDERLVLSPSGEIAFQLERSLHLTPVNNILTSVHNAYLEIEQRHITRETNELGHIVVTIDKFPKKTVVDLEESLWKQLDEVVDVDQQRILRNSLKVHAGGENGQEQYALIPSVLGMGRDGATIELWRVGAWFHWNVRMGPASDKFKGQGPDLPGELKRFWSDD
jgi:predicted Ser/Thr protein kinase